MKVRTSLISTDKTFVSDQVNIINDFDLIRGDTITLRFPIKVNDRLITICTFKIEPLVESIDMFNNFFKVENNASE